MAKRQQGVSPKRMGKGPHKTAKRIEAKHKMLAAKRTGTKKRAK